MRDPYRMIKITEIIEVNTPTTCENTNYSFNETTTMIRNSDETCSYGESVVKEAKEKVPIKLLEAGGRLDNVRTRDESTWVDFTSDHNDIFKHRIKKFSGNSHY